MKNEKKGNGYKVLWPIEHRPVMTLFLLHIDQRETLYLNHLITLYRRASMGLRQIVFSGLHGLEAVKLKTVTKRLLRLQTLKHLKLI